MSLIQGAHGTPVTNVTNIALHAIASVGGTAQAGKHGLGSPVAEGEAPLAQACMLYPLKSFICRLTEVDTRTLLGALRERCTALLDSTSALPARSAPEAIVLLTAMSSGLSGVGQIASEDADRLRDIVHRLLISSPSAVRYAAAAALGQLAAVEGGSAATLLSEYLSLVTLQTASLGSQSSRRQGATYPLRHAPSGAH